jgi:RimJ/RimL family protein N-acetyltransferase
MEISLPATEVPTVKHGSSREILRADVLETNYASCRVLVRAGFMPTTEGRMRVNGNINMITFELKRPI